VLRISPGQVPIVVAFPVIEPFLAADAFYFRRGDQLWRVPKDGGDAAAVAPLPRGAAFLGVGANRIVMADRAIDICSGAATPLQGSGRLAADSCAIREVVGDTLAATPIAAPARIDRVVPAAAAPGQLVQLFGAGFDPLARVTVAGAEAAVVFASETELDLLLPKFAAGATIEVENRGGPCAAAFFSATP
jgi:hypothetical protein